MKNGYIGLLLLLIGACLSVYLYLNYTPLRPSPDGTARTEGQAAIDSAAKVKEQISIKDDTIKIKRGNVLFPRLP